MALAHEFAWSVSRHGNFAECRRRFYFDYYQSWLGWEAGGDPDRRRAYLLKKMTRMPMHAGDCLHRALERWFQARAAGEDQDLEELQGFGLSELRLAWRQSRDESEAWARRPKGRVRLAEHHYQEKVVEEASGQAAEYGGRYRDRLLEGLRFFIEAPELELVRTCPPSDWLACEEMGTIELFGTKIYAVPDFAFRDPEGGVHIYDWKSGAAREADRFQLALYALYAEQVWEVDPTEVNCVDVYLPRAELVSQRFSAEELEAVLGEIHGSISAMRALHFDASLGLGEPSQFAPIPADAPEARACSRCNYRELCDRS